MGSDNLQLTVYVGENNTALDFSLSLGKIYGFKGSQGTMFGKYLLEALCSESARRLEQLANGSADLAFSLVVESNRFSAPEGNRFLIKEVFGLRPTYLLTDWSSALPEQASDLPGSALFPAGSFADTLPLADLCRELFLRHADAYCPVCRVYAENSSLDRRLVSIRQQRQSGILVLAALLGENGFLPSEMTLAECLDFTSKNFLIVDGLIVGQTELEAESFLNRSLADYADKGEKVFLVMASAVLPLGREDELLFHSEAVHCFAAGLPRLTLLYFDNRQTAAKEQLLLTESGTCPGCRQSFRPLSESLLQLALKNELCPECQGKGELASGSACSVCESTGLKGNYPFWRLGEVALFQLRLLSVTALADWLDSEFAEPEADDALLIARIRSVLSLLKELGFSHKRLGQPLCDFSTGELLCLKLGLLILSGLSDAIVGVDGLAPLFIDSDRNCLISALRQLAHAGNLCLLVDENQQFLDQCDCVFSLEGKPELLSNRQTSLTPEAVDIEIRPEDLSHQTSLFLDPAANDSWELSGIQLPLEKLICLRGSCGSGKSLLLSCLAELASDKHKNNERFWPERVVSSLYRPAADSDTACLATLTGVYDDLVGLFSQSLEARLSGVSKVDFSLSKSSLRCRHCLGSGLAGAGNVPAFGNICPACPACAGSRFERRLLRVRYKNKNISDVLHLSVAQAADFFWESARIHRKLSLLQELNLAALMLGMPIQLMSWTVRKRLDLYADLLNFDRSLRDRRKSEKKTLFLLDQPFLGLLPDSLKEPLRRLRDLSENGHTVLCVDNSAFAANHCDYLIELCAADERRSAQLAGLPLFFRRFRVRRAGWIL